VYDNERRRRPGERDVELAQALSLSGFLHDQRWLDNNHVIEFHAFRFSRREKRDAGVVEEGWGFARITAE